MIGTEYLLIILLWCGTNPGFSVRTDACRREKIKCVRELKNFTTNDVIDKCLSKEGLE